MSSEMPEETRAELIADATARTKKVKILLDTAIIL